MQRNVNDCLYKRRFILASAQSKTSSYEIADLFLRFWFRFICPYQSLIESGQLKLLRTNINTHYERFSGKTLERYFQTLLMESGEFSQVGNWWDRKGENEMDIVAINEFTHQGLIAEVKRNEQKINLHALSEKADKLPSAEFGRYQFRLCGFSIKDM